MPLKRGPSGALGVQMYGGGSAMNDNRSGGDHYTFAPVYQVNEGVTRADLAKVQKRVDEDQRNFVGKVAQANKELNKRNYR